MLAWVVAASCIFIGLGSPPLMDPDEGRNTEVAREMKAARSFLVPLYNGMPYLDKPALYFDAVAASLAVFGDNEAAARLQSALFGALTLVVVWLFCRHVYGNRAASIAVLIVATTLCSSASPAS
jgi:4-amino-4-deoxy-L-arabinose transferase-like glycosyltransferase